MKKYFIDLGMGGISAVACFLLGHLSFIFSEDLRYYLWISFIAIFASIPVYLKTQLYKKNHPQKISMAGVSMFLLGTIVVYIALLYLEFSISFVMARPI